MKNNMRNIKNEFAKKSYKEPELKEIGSVLKLTQQVKVSLNGDNANGANQKAVS